MIAKLKKTRLLFVQSVFPASTLRRLRGLTLHVDGRAEELCSATPACSGCQGEAGRRQGSLISCWHLSYVFVYQEQGSTTGERQILSREWLSWSLVLSVSREGGGEEVCCCIIQILYLHIQYSKGFRANTHTEGNRHTHTQNPRLGGQVRLFSRWALYLPLSSDVWEFYLKPKRGDDLSLQTVMIDDPPV